VKGEEEEEEEEEWGNRERKGEREVFVKTWPEMRRKRSPC
jgi:hypothetical protein